MENKKGGDLICKRPETIIEARYSLTKRQNDILDMVFASIEDDDKLKYEIDIAKYGQLYNIKDKSNIYRDLKKAVNSFEGKGFSITQKISEKKENRIYFSWFSRIVYLDGESKIFIGIDEMLKELMLSAKKACFYQIKYPLNFHNIYSKRLYYYLKSYENSNKDGTGWRIDDLDELRNKLECPKSYNVYYEFKRYVLKPAYEEINGNSDISFEYEVIKDKGKVTSIKFYIHSNPINQTQAETVTTTDPIDDTINDLKAQIDRITGGSIGANVLTRLIDKHSVEKVEKYIELYPKLTKGKTIANTVGFFINSIVCDYELTGKNNINAMQFDQREYTDQELDNLFDDVENYKG